MDGESVVYEKVEWESLKKGMIVVRWLSGERVCHRLVKKEGDFWLTKGDNNTRVDHRPMRRGELVGVVREIEGERI